MSIRSIVNFSLLIAAFYGSTAATADKRIVNGVLAVAKQYPYQASLQTVTGNAHFCGGSILNTRWIVTAASCLDNVAAPSTIQVVVGTLTLPGSTPYPVASFMKHPLYVATTRISDAAIVQTTTVIVTSDTVKAIPLASYIPSASSIGVVTGWGPTTPTGTDSTDLYSLSTKVISNTECISKLVGSTTTLQSTHICTYTAGSGACGTDHGGPITISGVQFGIVSYPYCGNYPDVYTSTSKVFIWILTNAV